MMSFNFSATYADFMTVYKSFMYASWPLQGRLKHQLHPCPVHSKYNAYAEGFALSLSYFVQHMIAT